jgi:hypothetical protein
VVVENRPERAVDSFFNDLGQQRRSGTGNKAKLKHSDPETPEAPTLRE